ncbi:hypothetical protein FACS1894132_02840 [Clostridia bacterium]|nr:hypothetical protein FACS1894132_02840 [Clostridia bacterium]
MKKSVLNLVIIVTVIFLVCFETAGFFVVRSSLLKNAETMLNLRNDNAERVIRDFYGLVGAKPEDLTAKFQLQDNINVTYGDKVIYKSDKYSFTPNFSEDNEIVERTADRKAFLVVSRAVEKGWFVVTYVDKSEIFKPLFLFCVVSFAISLAFLIALLCLLSSLIKKSIITPIESVIKVNEELSGGNTQIKLVAVKQQDELAKLVASSEELVNSEQKRLEIIKALALGETDQVKIAPQSDLDEFAKHFKTISDRFTKNIAFPMPFKKGVNLIVDVITELEDYTSKILEVSENGLYISIPQDTHKVKFDSKAGEVYNVSFVDKIAGSFSVAVEVVKIEKNRLNIRPVTKFENEQRRNYVRVPATGITAVMFAKVFDENRQLLVDVSEFVPVMDISIGGIRIKITNVLNEGAAVTLKLKSESFGDLDVVGEVRRILSINGSIFAGIEFFSDPATTEILYQFIRTKEMEIIKSGGGMPRL